MSEKERYPCPALVLRPTREKSRGEKSMDSASATTPVWYPGWDADFGNLEYLAPEPTRDTAGAVTCMMSRWRSDLLRALPSSDSSPESGFRAAVKLRLRHDTPGMASELAAWVYSAAIGGKKATESYEVRVTVRRDVLRIEGPRKTVEVRRLATTGERLPAMSADIAARLQVPELSLANVPYALAMTARAVVDGSALVEKAGRLR